MKINSVNDDMDYLKNKVSGVEEYREKDLKEVQRIANICNLY